MRVHPVLVALCAAAFAAPVAAQTLCDPDLDTATCPPGSVDKYCPVVLDGSCTSGKGLVILGASDPPPPQFTEIVCQFDYVNSGYFCDAWPKRGELAYEWDAIGEVQFTSSRHGDYADVRCLANSGNQISVTVTSPYGLSTTTTVSINCSFLIDP
ncbi:MAG TPA: hypothetical protein VLF18_07140 [Tahibacter sp.]|uniref:hypothetical protein n=1 Tax=Tahibacter sp. TaxID=2056211 RepID=UPI002C68A94A|nr:hypothetical protein [Tahibacter sp.]HSX59957.1 hypothetical protein [Tahibacter sp.]